MNNMKMSGNNKNVAFLIPYYEGRNHSPFLGIGYLSQILRKTGFDTLILDEDAICFLMEDRGHEYPLPYARNFIIKKLQGFSPIAVGITINTTNYERCLQLLKTIRESFPEVCVIAGGPHISTSWFYFRKFHSDLFDIAVIGEGEATIVEICNRVAEGALLDGIPGTVLSNEEKDNFKPQSLISNLDMLPYPDREGFFSAFEKKELPVIEEHYQRGFYSHLPGFRGKRYERIVGSRGCDFACSFCSPSVFWRNPFNGKPNRRIRDPINIVNEIEYLFDRGYDAFYFDDPTFPFDSKPDFLNGFIYHLTKRGIKISWSAPTRYDELSKDTIEKLAKIGFSYTYFGLETNRQNKLIEMRKAIDIDQCLKVIKWCDDHGIHCDVSYQIGLPDDDYDAIVESIQWLEKHDLKKRSFFSLAAIWPETTLALKHGLSSEDYEPIRDKTSLERRGLYYFKPGNPEIERYYSNCSGTYHFIDLDTAIRAKHYLIDAEFIKRFENDEIP